MKIPQAAFTILTCLLPLAGKAARIEFDLRSHTAAVALQFDVSSTVPGDLDLLSPELNVATPHAVESAKLSSGAVRYVVYSTAGQPISGEGKIRVTFQADFPLADGVLQISNLVDSDANGQRLSPVQNPSTLPNILPVLVSSSGGHRSFEVGVATRLSAASVVDPDGSVASVEHLVGGQSKGSAAAAPFSIAWTPEAPGFFPWTATATDNRGGSISLGLGNIHSYGLADISSFAAFGQIHYGSAANPAWYTFGADPLNIGIHNGIAYLLGLNPHNPDRSRLPAASVEPFSGEPHFIFRFVRSDAPGVSWSVWQSADLDEWAGSLPGEISQTPLGGGLTEVLVRRPLSSVPEGKLFMQLEADE